MSKPRVESVQDYHVLTAADTLEVEGSRMMPEKAFCALLHKDRLDKISSYLGKAQRGEVTVSLELTAADKTCLLVVQPHESGVGVCALIIPLDDVIVPEAVADRVLGMRKGVIHDVCNDLTAARLSSELASNVLQRSADAVDPRVEDALNLVVRVSDSIERQLRELQRGVKLDLPGITDRGL